MAVSTPRTQKLVVRLSAVAKRRLRIAAEAIHRPLHDFVLESALARADEMLLVRRRFGLDAKLWSELQGALDAPSRPLPRMAKLIAEPSVFESGYRTPIQRD